MKWLRRIAAGPLLLLALICTIGAVRIFTHDLPDETVGSGVFAAVLAAAAAVGTFFLLRPDLVLLRQLSFAQVRDWAYWNPLGQAVLLYAIAAIVMLAIPEYQLAPAFLATTAATGSPEGAPLILRLLPITWSATPSFAKSLVDR